MKQIVEHIVNKEHTKANELIEQHIGNILESKLNEVKKMIAARIDEQIIVQSDGMAHTASGEEILPSVLRQRRQLAEGKWLKKVQPGDKPSVVKAKKKQAHPPLPPGLQAAKERAELLRRKKAEKAKAKEQAASTEQKSKAAEITKEADPYAEKVKIKAARVERIFGPTAAQRYTEKAMENKPKPRPSLPKDKYAQLSTFGKLKHKLGLDEAKMKAKSILETKALDQAKSDIEALGSKKYNSPMPKATKPKIDAVAIKNYLDDYAKTARESQAAQKKKPK
jgi:hypothetical protein